MTSNEWFLIGTAVVIAAGYTAHSYYARKKSFKEFLAQKEKRRTDPPINVPKPQPQAQAAPPRNATPPASKVPLSKSSNPSRPDRGALEDTLEEAVDARRRAYVPPVYAEPTVYDRTPPACSKPSRSDMDDSHSHRSCSSSSSSYGGGDSSSSSSSCSSSSSSSDSGSSGCD